MKVIVNCELEMAGRSIRLSEKKSRAAKMKNEILITAKGSINETRIDTTIFHLCGTVAIEHSRANVRYYR